MKQPLIVTQLLVLETPRIHSLGILRCLLTSIFKLGWSAGVSSISEGLTLIKKLSNDQDHRGFVTIGSGKVDAQGRPSVHGGDQRTLVCKIYTNHLAYIAKLEKNIGLAPGLQILVPQREKIGDSSLHRWKQVPADHNLVVTYFSLSNEDLKSWLRLWKARIGTGYIMHSVPRSWCN